MGKLSRLNNPLLVIKKLNIKRNTNAKFVKNILRAALNFQGMRQPITKRIWLSAISARCCSVKKITCCNIKILNNEWHLQIYVYIQSRNFHKDLILQIESNWIKFVNYIFMTISPLNLLFYYFHGRNFCKKIFSWMRSIENSFSRT